MDATPLNLPDWGFSLSWRAACRHLGAVRAPRRVCANCCSHRRAESAQHTGAPLSKPSPRFHALPVLHAQGLSEREEQLEKKKMLLEKKINDEVRSAFLFPNSPLLTGRATAHGM